MSAYRAGVHYGIKGSMTVYRWLDNRASILGTFAENPDKMEKAKALSQAELTAELQTIRRLLEIERLRSESYLTMIKLAEDQYKIPIEKKFGTKRSK